MTRICVTLSTPHTSYKEWKCMWVQIHTIYDVITNVILCHISHINNGNICGTGQRLHEFIWNSDQLESLCCYTTYINTCDYTCNIHPKNGWFKIQCPILYLLYCYIIYRSSWYTEPFIWFVLRQWSCHITCYMTHRNKANDTSNIRFYSKLGGVGC